MAANIEPLNPRCFYPYSMISCKYRSVCILYSLQVPLPEQDGPENEVQSSLTELSAKELAYHLTVYENQLFRSVSVVSYSE